MRVSRCIRYLIKPKTRRGAFIGEFEISESETSNDPEFSKQLSKHGSIFINDAFGLAHRAHASNYGVAKHFKHKGMGLLIEKEIQYLDKIMRKPDRPLALILGGAKIDTKLDLITTFLDKADIILIGGGMSFTFLKAKGKKLATH